MRSSRRRPEPDPPTFFIDRGLGKHHVARVFASAKYTVVLMRDVYPDDGQRVDDETWIERASAEGWVALTKDAALVRDHAAALSTSTLRVFSLPNANLTGPEMAARFEANLHRIAQQARRPGPFVDVVHPDRVVRRWPPPARRSRAMSGCWDRLQAREGRGCPCRLGRTAPPGHAATDPRRGAISRRNRGPLRHQPAGGISASQNLREAGLVDVHADRQRRFHVVRPDGLGSLEAFLTDLWPASLQRLKRAVDGGDDR